MEISCLIFSWKFLQRVQIVHGTIIPHPFFVLMPALVDHLISSQVHVTAITEATGICIVEASPLLEISVTTTSTVHKLFIYSKAKLRSFLCASKE
jgi:hypothetical protein